jgi:serine/threonine-protein kinase
MAMPVPAAPPDGTSPAELERGRIPAEVPRASPRPGGVEERYRSLFVIGRGGMGSVEVALECGGDAFTRADRVVALKTLLPEGAHDTRHKEMFLREARLAALLQHPNVVHAFAFGELYGELFLAMEYVEGEPLSRVLAEARGGDGKGLAHAVVALVLAEACDGLHAAHELRDVGGQPLGVVHRDVSPQNIMVSYDGRVKILDFGVAKFETGGHETRTGEIKGKMAYMSPEQALGEKLDRRSDLFSVGAVLFEGLTGERMWGSGTDMEVMRKLALEQPPALEAALPGAPRALVELHARLVARAPEGRPATAQDVARELRGYARTNGAPDLGAVRTVMRRLFAAEEARRRAQLTEALERVAPGRASELRRRLTSLAERDRVTSIEPVLVGVPPGPPSQPGMSRDAGTPLATTRSRLGLALALAGAVVVGAGVTAGAMRREAAPISPPVAAATSAAPPEPPPARPLLAAESATAPSEPTGTTKAPVRKANPPATSAAPSPRPASGGRTRPRGESRLSNPKLPDVDPTPF